MAYCDEHKAEIARRIALESRLKELEDGRHEEWPKFWQAINARLKGAIGLTILLCFLTLAAAAFYRLDDKIGSVLAAQAGLGTRITQLETKMDIHLAQKP